MQMADEITIRVVEFPSLIATFYRWAFVRRYDEDLAVKCAQAEYDARVLIAKEREQMLCRAYYGHQHAICERQIGHPGPHVGSVQTEGRYRGRRVMWSTDRSRDRIANVRSDPNKGP